MMYNPAFEDISLIQSLQNLSKVNIQRARNKKFHAKLCDNTENPQSVSLVFFRDDGLLGWYCVVEISSVLTEISVIMIPAWYWCVLMQVKEMLRV